ncbi:hypothetical protein RYA05_04480 [Pseudomonas syringae pv. actinidiae]|nr:hypothetical protein [Pseudomonas syringae pv. actinidiae]
MSLPNRMDFEKCFFTAVPDGRGFKCALSLHGEDLSAKDAIEITIDLLRNGIPVVSVHDREPIAAILSEYLDFVIEHRPCGMEFFHCGELFWQFLGWSNYLRASRFAQGLRLMQVFTGGYAGPNDFSLTGLCKPRAFHFDFLDRKQFKADITSRNFDYHRSFGEAVIPQGEYLTLDKASDAVRLEAGTTLGLRAVRFYGSAGAYQRKSGIISVHAGADVKQMPLVINCDQPVVLDAATMPGNVDTPVLGKIPMHWITKVKTEEEHVGPENTIQAKSLALMKSMMAE